MRPYATVLGLSLLAGVFFSTLLQAPFYTIYFFKNKKNPRKKVSHFSRKGRRERGDKEEEGRKEGGEREKGKRKGRKKKKFPRYTFEKKMKNTNKIDIIFIVH